MLEATKTYLEAEDAFQLWLSDAITRDSNAWESTAELFQSWTSWSKAAGEQTGSQKRFVQALDAAGFTAAKNPGKTKRGFRGLKLNRPDLASDPGYAD